MVLNTITLDSPILSFLLDGNEFCKYKLHVNLLLGLFKIWIQLQLIDASFSSNKHICTNMVKLCITNYAE